MNYVSGQTDTQTNKETDKQTDPKALPSHSPTGTLKFLLNLGYTDAKSHRGKF